MIYPASCAEQEDETGAKMGHPVVTGQCFGNRYTMDAVEIKLS